MAPECPAIPGTLSSIWTVAPNTFNLQCLQCRAKVTTIFSGKPQETRNMYSVSTTQAPCVERRFEADWLITAVEVAEAWNESWWHRDVLLVLYHLQLKFHTVAHFCWLSGVGLWGTEVPGKLSFWHLGDLYCTSSGWAHHECWPPAQKGVAICWHWCTKGYLVCEAPYMHVWED